MFSLLQCIPARRLNPTSFVALLAIPCFSPPPLAAQQDPQNLEQRIQRLEEQNRELQRMVAGISDPMAEGDAIDNPVSIGGYGEVLFTERQGRSDIADSYRVVLYFGYQFDEKWSLQTELEVEHADEIFVEMAQINYQATPNFAARAGMLLVPMGIINERHEPTTFMPNQRPETEKRIIPTTWREIGAGVQANVGDVEYKLYTITALNGDGFNSSGLRYGRQKGSKAESDDMAGVLSANWTVNDSLVVGASAYYGPAGQDNIGQNGDGDDVPIPRMATSIVEAHAEWNHGPWNTRALYATSWIDDAGDFNAITERNIAKQLEGYYIEAGYDVFNLFDMPECGNLSPFFRWEHINTQFKMPANSTAQSAEDNEIFTFGLNYKPVSQVVFKIDYAVWNNEYDRFTIGMGYVF